MKIRELLRELNKLKLPTNKFAITSSGPLGIRNIREINDLDLIVYPELWQELSAKYPLTNEGDFESICIGNIQISGKGSWFTDPQFGDLINQIDDADLFNSYRFVKLETILKIKKNKTRPKDIEDVRLIENYLSNNSR